MADNVLITGEKTVTVVTVGAQGPAGVSGSSVPATTSTLGGVIIGANLSITGNGVLSATGGGGSVTTNLPWANITGKPTFANVATSGLYTDLTGTPNLSVYLTTTAASATYALISSLASYLTTANASTNYSVLGHTHAISNVINLQSTLDAKQPTGSYVLTSNSALTDARTPLAHTQAFSTITGLPATLASHGITDGLLITTAASTYATISSLSVYATLASPTLTGTPSAPTATAGASTTQLATTAFVTGGISTLSNTVAATYLTASDANNAFAIRTRSILSGTGLTGGGTLELNRTLSLAVSNATAGTYGSATVVPVITVDIYGRITSVSNIAISGGGGGVTSVTGGTGITVTGTTTPTVAIDSTVVATLTGTQTLTNKSIAAEQLNSGTLANARLGVSTTALTYAASVTWASDYLKVATITLAGACALTITGLTAGGTYNLIVKQDATGSRIITWPTIKWSAGAAPVLSTAANAMDIVSLIYDGTTLFGTALKGFA